MCSDVVAEHSMHSMHSAACRAQCAERNVQCKGCCCTADCSAEPNRILEHLNIDHM